MLHSKKDNAGVNFRRWFAFTVVSAGGLITALSLSAQTPARNNEPITARERGFLARCVLGKVNTDWVFAETGDALQFRDKRIRTYLGGSQSIRYDLSIFECIAELTGSWNTEEQRWGDKSSLADLAGIPLYSARQGGQEHSDEINYYNPELIKWAEKQIPDPGETINGIISYQQVYNVMARRNARILVRTYNYLQEGNRFNEILNRYRAAEYHGRLEIRSEFRNLFGDEFVTEASDPYEFNFHSGHAITFWMRRGMDDTRVDVWRLLSSIMKKYDPDFR